MDTRLFYQNENLYTLIRSDTARSLLYAAGRAHAEHQKNALGSQSLLMATNKPGSVLQTCTTNGQAHSLSYSAYGAAAVGMSVAPMMMFNCQWYELLTGCYPLGNGYRMFSPQLMRFYSPDSLSPFSSGGMNAYAYCHGDPVNLSDPTGHGTPRPLLKGRHSLMDKAFKTRQIAREGQQASLDQRLQQTIGELSKVKHKIQAHHEKYSRLLDVFQRQGKDGAESLNIKTTITTSKQLHKHHDALLLLRYRRNALLSQKNNILEKRMQIRADGVKDSDAQEARQRQER